MCVVVAITGTILFLILTPGILLRIPEKGPILKAAIIHSIIFGILLYFISKIIYQYSNIENFKTNSQTFNSTTVYPTCQKILSNNKNFFDKSRGNFVKNRLIFEAMEKIIKIELFLCKKSKKNIDIIDISYFKQYFDNIHPIIKIIDILNKIITSINDNNTKNTKNYKSLCDTLLKFEPIEKIASNDSFDILINDLIDYLNTEIPNSIKIILCS